MCGGFLMAATLHKDHTAQRASQGLCPTIADGFHVFAQEHARHSTAARAKLLRSIAQEIRHSVPHNNPLPPQGKALLSGEVPGDVGRAWLKAARPLRTSFRPSRALQAVLRQLSNLERAREAANKVQNQPEKPSLCHR